MSHLASSLASSGADLTKLLRALVILVIALSISVVWLDARKNHYVPCAENCGEAFLVFKYVQNYRLYGFKHGLLEDIATTPDPDRQPYLYTHNANLPGVFYALMDAAGLHQLWQKQMLLLSIHGLGLAFIFITVSRLGRSVALGFTTLVLFCLDYDLVFNFAMNPLRAWHWLALFGLLYCAVRMAENRSSQRASIIGLVFFSILTFGLGYDFFAICATIAFLAILLWLPRPFWSVSSARVVVQFAAVLAVPVILRQLQVMLVLGRDFWIRDIGYSLLSKIPALRDFFSAASNEEIARYYLSRGVVHFDPPEAIPLGEFLAHLTALIKFILLPTTGLLTPLIAALVCIFSALYIALRSLPSVRAWVVSRVGVQREVNVTASSRIVIAVGIGSLLGMAIFPYHNVQIYVKHLAPLLAAPLYLGKAALIVFLLTALRSVRRRGFQVAACAVLLAVTLDHLIVQSDDIRSKAPYDMGWIAEVESRADAVFAISWQPTAVSVFTRRDAVSLSPPQQTALLARVKGGRAPVEQATDVTQAITLPGDRPNADVRPDYWLYFPTDNMSPFDNPTPHCRQDYLTAALSAFTQQKSTQPPKVVNEWIRPTTAIARPGDYIVFGGKIQNRGRELPELALSIEENFDHELAVNCQHNSYMGWVKTFTDSFGEYTLVVGPRAPKTAISSKVKFKVAPDAPPPGFSFPTEAERVGLPMPWPMPSADRLVSEYPEIPIAVRGPGWVLFDLRPLYREPRN